MLLLLIHHKPITQRAMRNEKQEHRLVSCLYANIKLFSESIYPEELTLAVSESLVLYTAAPASCWPGPSSVGSPETHTHKHTLNKDRKFILMKN